MLQFSKDLKFRKKFLKSKTKSNPHLPKKFVLYASLKAL